VKIPLRWLQAYVSVDLPPKELAERLTMSGSLVERVHNTGGQWDSILVGRIAALEKHPNADALWLATVDLGDRRQTVVTGAPNLFEGAMVAFVGVGLTLPGEDRPLEGKVLRGIRSEGMVCSGRELGINDDHSGILILDPLLGERAGDPRLLGTPLSHILGEWVFELEITPNRPDCLAVFGIAREVAAITGAALHPPPVALDEAPPPASALAAVRIEAPDLCSRYAARVITGVTVGPSPSWLVERLQAAGMRSINNVVDVTNYVMLEMGQPLHAFDLDRVAGHRIIVRRAYPGETLVTLDGVTRQLTQEMLLIADDERAVGIAGVMGGGNSEVSETTTRILLESATFNARSVRRTSGALGLRTEASSRFEKGLPRTLSPLAADRAASLLAELAGGTVAASAIIEGEADPEPRRILFPLEEVPRLLGVDWPVQRITGNLEALGFSCRAVDAASVEVTVPWWREDVVESADLVEEVARVTGFDAIPETLLRNGVPPRPTSPGYQWHGPARHLLLACGLSEGSSPALTSARSLELLQPTAPGRDWLDEAVPNAEGIRAAGGRFEPLRVVNPLSPEREYLRLTLLPGLLEALGENLRNGEDRVAFFELDACHFSRADSLPVERRSLAIAMSGERSPRSWAHPSVPLDFYDLKGVVEALIHRLGIEQARIVAATHPLLHPGRSALVRVDGQTLGFLGELHPAIAERWDLGYQRAYVAEFDFDGLVALARATRAFVDYPRLPTAKRDLAVVVDESRPAEEVEQAIREAGKGLLSRISLFDVYRGEPLPAGSRSLAYALEFQDPERTLTEDQVDKAMGRITRALQHRVGASLRG
jgi:phenylalanyl-tRNA synthetase beta chain